MKREITERLHGRRLLVGPVVRASTVVCLLIVAAGAVGGTRAQVDPQPGPQLAHSRSVLAAFWMRWAVNDAARRLQKPDCRRILTDFTDQSGNLLSANLSRLAMTPVEFIERGLFFVDASDRGPCLSDSRGMFTFPGSRVIFVCATQLVPMTSAPSPKIGLLIIHEALHALGLGENPPSSARISRQVARRCDS